jgi:ribosomal protein S25
MIDLRVLTFAEARQPEFKEKKGVDGGYIKYGENNDYPEYIVDLYNKSSKHSAIVKSKVHYITGNGWSGDADAQAFIDKANRLESLNDLTRKVSLDIEIFGGAFLEIIWDMSGNLAEIWHCDYTKMRTNKDNTQYWYKEDWKDNKVKPIVVAAFNPKQPTGKQILYVKEYRPNIGIYGLPSYFAALNYIESDIEVSKHILGNAQTGFSASKLITLPNGEPNDEEKRNVDNRIRKTYSGADGKKYMIAFVNDISRKPVIDDLGTSDLTKEDFAQVDELIQTNIFSGHQVTTPSIMGIAEAGKLGTRTEMRDGYEIFKNTYVNAKQMHLESVFNMLAKYKGVESEIKIIPTEPIGIEFSEMIISQNMTKDEIREKLNLPILQADASSASQRVVDGITALSPLVANKVLESMTPDEIRALIGLPPTNAPQLDASGNALPPVEELSVNEHIKGLKGREWQNMQRIIREFNKGKINREQASAMLKTGYALSDEEVATWLGAELDAEFAAQDFSVFYEFGESQESYNVWKSKKRFSEEADFYMFADVTQLESDILDQIAKQKDVTPEVLAEVLDESVETINNILKDLEDRKILKTTEEKIGKGINSNIIISRQLVQPLSKTVGNVKPQTTEILVRYSYGWKSGFSDSDLTNSRPFCKELIRAKKLYSRSDIEQISARLGYSVWDRGGGWWTMPDGDHSESCRHEWKTNIVTRKK